MELDVIPASCAAFTESESTLVYEAAGVRLLHGAVVEPGTHTAAALGEVSELFAESACFEDPQSVKSLLIQEWLQQRPSAGGRLFLSPAGLRGLRSTMAEGQLAVVYLNDHFTTALKRNGEVHILESWAHKGWSWEMLVAGQAKSEYYPVHGDPGSRLVAWASLAPLSPEDAALAAAVVLEPSAERERAAVAAARALAAAQEAAAAAANAQVVAGAPPAQAEGACKGSAGGAPPATNPESSLHLVGGGRSPRPGGTSAAGSSGSGGGGGTPHTASSDSSGGGSGGGGSGGGLSPSCAQRIAALPSQALKDHLHKLIHLGLSGAPLGALLKDAEAGVEGVEGALQALQVALAHGQAAAIGSGGATPQETGRPALALEVVGAIEDTAEAEVQKSIARARVLVAAATSPRNGSD